MTSTALTTAVFPAFKHSIRALWAPLLLAPIAGSYERLVIGVAVVGEHGFHVELANALDRLRCFYGEDAASIMRAIHLSAEHIKYDLSRRGQKALIERATLVSGVSIGECREAEGATLNSIGESWMKILSSLYRSQIYTAVAELAPELPPTDIFKSGGDRLPILVLDYVRNRREGLGHFFSEDIRARRMRRSGRRSHEVLIDFAGSKIVANFGTLRVTSISNSVGILKQRLWELKVDRDKESVKPFPRNHEMIVQRPDADDPQITKRQSEHVQEALASFEQQADQEELRFRTFGTVPEIGDHVLIAEAA
jgi:hypothetical protein